MAEHDVAPLGERHPLHNWEYADAATRTAATGFIAADVTKWAKQLDDGTYWELTDDSPVTWAQRTGGGGALADDSVTNTKLANMAQATIKGRASGAGTGDPQDLTSVQATAILDVVVGDSGSGGTKGLVPAPAAGDAAAGKFLHADGTYQSPSGGGGTWTMVKKTANETKNSDTTITDDAALQFSMLANTKYMVRARIYWNSTVAADIKWRHAGPASPTLLVVKWKSQAPGSGSVTDDVNETYSGSDNVIASLSAAHAGYIEIDAIIHNGVNAGAFSFQWAQNTSDAGDTIVYAGSWLEHQTV